MAEQPVVLGSHIGVRGLLGRVCDTGILTYRGGLHLDHGMQIDRA